MIYAIIIWVMIALTTLWIIIRFHNAYKKTDHLLHLNKPHHMIRSWTTRNSTLTSLYVILAWWISLMFTESLRLSSLNTPQMNNHMIVLVTIPILILSIQTILNTIMSRRYHMTAKDIGSQLNRTFYIMIAFLYGLIISYGVEAFILVTT